jgi:hypothetical protein
MKFSTLIESEDGELVSKIMVLVVRELASKRNAKLAILMCGEVGLNFLHNVDDTDSIDFVEFCLFADKHREFGRVADVVLDGYEVENLSELSGIL